MHNAGFSLELTDWNITLDAFKEAKTIQIG